MWQQVQWVQYLIANYRAWYSVGQACLTKFLKTGSYPDVTIFPSHYFLPIHFVGNTYYGHEKIYAHQKWGTAGNSYISDTMDQLELPLALQTPPSERWVSVLVPSYNTPLLYIQACLQSIRCQMGDLSFGMELVWINDGSDLIHSEMLEKELRMFVENTRFCTLRYIKHFHNRGVAVRLKEGVTLCSYELIARMDSDDIMVPHRLITQLEFMWAHPECVICGGAIQLFSNEGNIHNIVRHPSLTWQVYEEIDRKPTWIMNHPTMIYRKEAVLNVGNYRKSTFVAENNTIVPCEDYDLTIRLLKTYGHIHNLPNVLVHYRKKSETL